jgi:hypothetical protein
MCLVTHYAVLGAALSIELFVVIGINKRIFKQGHTKISITKMT